MYEPPQLPPRDDGGDTPFWLSPFPFREPDWPPVDEEPE
jgi:hypothetical protein